MFLPSLHALRAALLVAVDGEVQRRPAVAVARVHVRPVLDQLAHHRRAQVLGRQVQRGLLEERGGWGDETRWKGGLESL